MKVGYTEEIRRYMELIDPTGLFKILDVLLEIFFARLEINAGNMSNEESFDSLAGEVLQIVSQNTNIIKSITTNYHEMKYAAEQIKKVEKLINELKPLDNNNTSKTDLESDLLDQDPILSIQNLSHAIKNSKQKGEMLELFSKLNIEIKKNEFILITGDSNTGKTTFFKMLQGQILPNDGTLLIGNKPLNEFSSTQLNRLISCIPLEVSLFENKPVIYNILYRLGPNIFSDDDLFKIHGMKTYSEISDFMKDNQDYKGILDTCRLLFKQFRLRPSVRKRTNCKNLSAGEKRRIGVVMTLLRDTPIMLFDEPTANLDAETANIIVNAICALRSKKTILVITHAPNLFSNNNIRRLKLDQKRFFEMPSIHDHQQTFFQPVVGVNNNANMDNPEQDNPAVVNNENADNPDDEVIGDGMRNHKRVLMAHARL